MVWQVNIGLVADLVREKGASLFPATSREKAKLSEYRNTKVSEGNRLSKACGEILEGGSS